MDFPGRSTRIRPSFASTVPDIGCRSLNALYGTCPTSYTYRRSGWWNAGVPSTRVFHDEQSTETLYAGPRFTSTTDTDWSLFITAPTRSIGSATAQGRTVASLRKSFTSHPIAYNSAYAE